jgi:hypothetical protein
MNQLLEALMTMAGTALNVVDTPGAMVRAGLHPGVTAGQVANPFDPSSVRKRVYGRDLLRNWGMIGKENTWGNFAGGMGIDVMTDPVFWASMGLFGVARKVAAQKAAGAVAGKANLPGSHAAIQAGGASRAQAAAKAAVTQQAAGPPIPPRMAGISGGAAPGLRVPPAGTTGRMAMLPAPQPWYKFKIQAAAEGLQGKNLKVASLASKLKKAGVPQWQIDEVLKPAVKGAGEKIPKAELLKRIKANSPRLAETVQGSAAITEPGAATAGNVPYEQFLHGGASQNPHNLLLRVQRAGGMPELTAAEKQLQAALSDARAFDRVLHGRYPEILAGANPHSIVTSAEKQTMADLGRRVAHARTAMDRVSSKIQYSSAHWPEKDVLSHARMDQRIVNVGGKPQKTLFVQEIQGDWPQQAAKVKRAVAGRNRQNVPALVLNSTLDHPSRVALAYLLQPVADQPKSIQAAILRVAQIGRRTGRTAKTAKEWNWLVNRLSKANPTSLERKAISAVPKKHLLKLARKRVPQIHKRMRDVAEASKSAPLAGNPPLPMQTPWEELTLHRALRFAAANNYDRVAINTARGAKRSVTGGGGKMSGLRQHYDRVLRKLLGKHGKIEPVKIDVGKYAASPPIRNFPSIKMTDALRKKLLTEPYLASLLGLAGAGGAAAVGSSPLLRSLRTGAGVYQ